MTPTWRYLARTAWVKVTNALPWVRTRREAALTRNMDALLADLFATKPDDPRAHDHAYTEHLDGRGALHRTWTNEITERQEIEISALIRNLDTEIERIMGFRANVRVTVSEPEAA